MKTVAKTNNPCQKYQMLPNYQWYKPKGQTLLVLLSTLFFFFFGGKINETKPLIGFTTNITE